MNVLTKTLVVSSVVHVCTLTTVFAQDTGQKTDSKGLSALETTTLISTRTQLSQKKSPASIVSIDLLDDDNDLQGDAGDLVRLTPGVDIPFEYRGVDAMIPYMNGGYMDYSVRGLGGNRILLQIDGIRQVPEYNSYLGGSSGGTTRAMFDPKVFESMDILKGSASALYGSDALGGVVAFETISLVDLLQVSERPWYLAASATFNDVNDGINLVGKAGVRSGNFYATVVNSYRDSSEQKNDKGEEAYPEDNKSNHVLTSFAYIPDDINRFDVIVEDYENESETDFTGIDAMGGIISYDDEALSKAEVSRKRVSFKYENTPKAYGLWDSLSAHLYYQESESDLTTKTVGSVFSSPRNRVDVMEFDHQTVGLNVVGSKILLSDTWKQTILAGVELSSEDTENTFVREDVLSNTYENKINTDPSTLNRYDFFVQDEIQYGQWMFVAGARYSHYEINPDNDSRYLEANPDVAESSDYSNDTVTPSLSVVYSIDDSNILWARYAMGIKNPTVEDYTGVFSHGGGSDPFIILANDGLDPERSDAFEIGYRKFTQFFQLDVSAYKTFYDDFIDSSILVEDNTAPEPDVYSSDNIDEAEIYGVDLSMQYQLEGLNEKLKGFYVKVSGAWAEGKNKTDDLYLATVSPFEAVTTFGYSFQKKWGASLTGTYRSKQNHAEAYEEQGYYVPDSSFIVDAYGYYQVTDNFKFKGGLRNLTDEKFWIWSNSSQGGHSTTSTERNVQPGLTYYITLEFVF